MHDENPSVGNGNQRTSLEGVARSNLLRKHFSDAEIQRLCALQLRRRTRPETTDVSLDLCRLQFARWLVEHGALSEEMNRRLEVLPWKEPASVASEAQGCTSSPRDGTSHGPLRDEVAPVSGRRRASKEWQLALQHTWTRIRNALARAAEIAFVPDGAAYRRGESGPWPPYWSSYSSGIYYGSERLFESEHGQMYLREWERW